MTSFLSFVYRLFGSTDPLALVFADPFAVSLLLALVIAAAAAAVVVVIAAVLERDATIRETGGMLAVAGILLWAGVGFGTLIQDGIHDNATRAATIRAYLANPRVQVTLGTERHGADVVLFRVPRAPGETPTVFPARALVVEDTAPVRLRLTLHEARAVAAALSMSSSPGGGDASARLAERRLPVLLGAATP